jgi:hypothetical protein
MPLKCGTHKMESIVYKPKDTVFVLPMQDGYNSYVVKAKFYDHDPISSDDYVGAPTVSWSWPPIKSAEETLTGLSYTGEPVSSFGSSYGHNDHVRNSFFYFWVKLYPNKAKQNP